MDKIRFLGTFIGGITGTIVGVGSIVACYIGLEQGFTAGLMGALVYATGYYAYSNRQSVEVAERSIKRRDEMMRYTYLADKWYEMMIKELDNPDFADQSKTSSYKTYFKGNKLRQYKSFARMCWGYAEDVYINNYHKEPSFEPSLKRCKQLHYSWLKETENRELFSRDFRKYIEELKID